MEHAQRIVQDVRDVLRSNRSVVLRGWHPENRILFDLADIAYLHPDIEQRVDAQGWASPDLSSICIDAVLCV